VLEDVKTIVEIAGTTVTALAVIAGGLWAYFKFVRGRTFRPRLELGMSGQWRMIKDEPLIHARLTVKNIGATNVSLLQKGTGLRISRLDPDQPGSAEPARWQRIRVFEIFREHAWIEPGETISDDLLIRLGGGQQTLLFELRLIWRWKRRDGNITAFARQIIPPDAMIRSPDRKEAGS
jgi:hypothetical protein